MDLGSDGQWERMPQTLRDLQLAVPIENIGSGPALEIAASVRLLDDAEEPTGPTLAGIAVAGLGAGGFQAIIVGYGALTVLPYMLTLEYDDVAGKGWKTTSVYADRRYEGTKVAECKRQRPLSSMLKPA